MESWIAEDGDEHDQKSRASGCRHRRRSCRACSRRPSDRPKHSRPPLRSGRNRRRERARLGPRPHVLAMALQHRRGVAKTPRSVAMARTEARCHAERRGDLRRVSEAFGGDAGDGGGCRDRRARQSRDTPRHGQGHQPRPRRPSLCARARDRRWLDAPRSRPRRDRCVRHLDQSEPARRQWIAGRRRERACEQDRLRHSGRAWSRAFALCRPQDSGRGRGTFGGERPARSGEACGRCAGHRDQLGGARQARTGLWRRRCRPAAGPGGARRRGKTDRRFRPRAADPEFFGHRRPRWNRRAPA